jgi:prophage regulatory protein
VTIAQVRNKRGRAPAPIPDPVPRKPKKPRKLISRAEVLARVALSYPQIWRMIRQKRFPQSVALTDRKIGFYEDEIDNWIASRKRVQLKPWTNGDSSPAKPKNHGGCDD